MDSVVRPADMSFPPEGLEWLLTGLVALGGALAASSGVGGGVLFVPLLVVIAKLPVAYAAPISNFVIALSAVSTFVIHLFETHPKDRTRPLLNFEALIYFVPIAVSSTSLGVMMSRALPEWLVNMLLFAFLVFAAYRMLARAIKNFRLEYKEKKMRREMVAVVCDINLAKDTDYLLNRNGSALSFEDTTTKQKENLKKLVVPPSLKSEHIEVGVLNGLKRDPSYDNLRATENVSPFRRQSTEERGDVESAGPLRDEDRKNTNTNTSKKENDNKKEAEEPEKEGAAARKGGLEVENGTNQEQDEEEQTSLQSFGVSVRSTKWWYWVLIFGSWGLQVFLSVIQTKTKECSPWDFLLLCVQPSTGVLVGVLVAHLIMKRYKEKTNQLGGHGSREGEIVLGDSWGTMVRMMIICLVIGALGGLLGVGGGSIMAPTLMELGASAVVVAPISSSLVLFSSSQAAVQYYLGGKLLPTYAIWLGAVNLLANYIGLYAVKRVVKKLGFTSFITFSLAILLVAAALFTVSFLVKNLLEHGFTPFPDYCSSK